jgi:hypothetical protein
MAKNKYFYCLKKACCAEGEELWFWSEKKYSEQELKQLLRKNWEAGVKEYRKAIEKMWDECEELFGMRKWPCLGKFIGKKGTYEDFVKWRDKWNWIAVNGKTKCVAKKISLHEIVPQVCLECGVDIDTYLEEQCEEH